MPLQASPFTRHDDHVHPFRVALEGILAGLSAAILVAIAHSLTDLVVGEPLRTPATLSTLFFEAEDGAGIHGILLFSALHISFWVAAGVASAYAIAVADAHPRMLRLVFVVLSFTWVTVLYLSGAISPDAMGSMRLWLGTLIGAAVVVGTLVFRHPRLLSQPERDRLTDASRSHLQQAFRIESESLAAAQEAVRSFAAPVFIDLAARKSAALAEISAALARLEIEAPSLSDAPPVVDPITLQSALRRALSRERDAVKSYDAFLASTDERALRRLLLDRRFEAFDENLPSLEAALREQDLPASGEPPDDPNSEDGSGAT